MFNLFYAQGMENVLDLQKSPPFGKGRLFGEALIIKTTFFTQYMLSK